MERDFGAVLTTGYLSFTMDTGEDSATEAANAAYAFAISGLPIYGSFGMPLCPSHARAYVRVAPAHVIAVIEIPRKN